MNRPVDGLNGPVEKTLHQKMSERSGRQLTKSFYDNISIIFPGWLAMLRTVDLAEQAYEQLKKQIRSGAFSEHEAVYENQLAERLGVSRTPIREAVRMLENEGLVERLTKGGILAVSITPRDLAVAIEARQALETIIVRWAATVITDEQLEELDNVLQQIKDPGVFRDLLKAVQAEHSEIADALRSRDVSRAVGAMASHQNAIGKRYQELFGVTERNSQTGGSNE